MKIEVVRKIDDRTTIMVNELAKVVDSKGKKTALLINEKAEIVVEMVDTLDKKLRKKD